MNLPVPLFLQGEAALKRSVADQAYAHLIELIITLQLPPGATITEVRLCEHLGIGRTPMREALQRLSYEGTIKILPRIGILISEINPAQQLKLLKVRRELEKVIAISAARYLQDSDRKRFAALDVEFQQAAINNDELAFVHADGAFNTLITTVAQNDYASNAVSPLRAQSTRFWYLHFRKFGDLPLICRLHSAIASAVALGDDVLAGLASDHLMDYVEAYTRSTLVR